MPLRGGKSDSSVIIIDELSALYSKLQEGRKGVRVGLTLLYTVSDYLKLGRGEEDEDWLFEAKDSPEAQNFAPAVPCCLLLFRSCFSTPLLSSLRNFTRFRVTFSPDNYSPRIPFTWESYSPRTAFPEDATRLESPDSTKVDNDADQVSHSGNQMPHSGGVLFYSLILSLSPLARTNTMKQLNPIQLTNCRV